MCIKILSLLKLSHYVIDDRYYIALFLFLIVLRSFSYQMVTFTLLAVEASSQKCKKLIHFFLQIKNIKLAMQ